MTTAFAVTVFALHVARAAENSSTITISHTPVTWGVKGQPLTLKARVSGGVGGVENVTLYYALFRDAAPFRVTMATSGMDLYVGTIESGLLTGVSSISYYIEAQDKEGTLEETPWYDVTFKNPDIAPARTGTSGKGATAAAVQEDESSAMSIGLIAGGAAAVAIGAYVISDSGGGSSDGGGSGNGTDPGAKAGTYNGSMTQCLTLQGEAPACSNSTIQIIVDSNGTVVSSTLAPGQSLSAPLNGSDFTLQADSSRPADNFAGTINFNGRIVSDTMISGTISGSADADGTPGTYSGSFQATK